MRRTPKHAAVSGHGLRAAHDGDFDELEPIEQGAVALCEASDDGQPLRVVRPVEAGMGGNDHPGVVAFGECLGEAGRRPGTGAAVQEQERVSGAVCVEGDIDVAAAGKGEAARCHGGSSWGCGERARRTAGGKALVEAARARIVPLGRSLAASMTRP
ncbi:hypothetical protein [Sorangium sp. So ce128]|uniref:hypothetical protein n=1 Tax=Sorangium sp. So ce128 TaxID=3133281 RepID=UPI003F5D9F6B